MSRFIGGPMHGIPVPDGVERMVFPNGVEFIRVPLLAKDEDGGLVQVVHKYVRTPYWRLAKPLIWFYAETSRSEDEILVLAREVFGL